MEGHSQEYRRKFVFDWIIYEILEGRVGSPAKIAEFEHTEAVEYIFRFDVSMDDELTV